MIVYAPWLMLVVVVIAILVVVASSNSNNNKNYSAYDNTSSENRVCYQQQEEKNENIVIDNSNITDFQRELQENTKTPQQVKDENKQKEIEQACSSANTIYYLIKQQLINQANSGNYITKNNSRIIYYDYKFRHRPSFIGCKSEHVWINKTILNPQGQYANKLTIFITNQDYYNNFMAKIQSLAGEDNISVKPLMIHKKNNSTFDYFPFTIQDFGVSEFDYDFVLRCIVSY